MTRQNWTEEDVFLIAERGHALFLQGRDEEATIIFEGLTALDPSNIYCANALAAICIRRGQLSRAVELLTRILDIYPNDADTRARRCEALLMAERVAEARKDWNILKRSTIGKLSRLKVLLELAESKTHFPKQLSEANIDN
jgi:Flp pilus assembly protein TadD